MDVFPTTDVCRLPPDFGLFRVILKRGSGSSFVILPLLELLEDENGYLRPGTIP